MMRIPDGEMDDLRLVSEMARWLVTETVESAATGTTELWTDAGLDGDRTARLIEVSRAVHRTALALRDVDRIACDIRAPHVGGV